MRPLSEAISNYIAERRDGKLEARMKRADGDDSASNDRQEIDAKFDPPNWLEDAASRARQISLVTHALKFAHSEAKGSSVSMRGQVALPGVLASGSMRQLQIDVVGNAAALDVANLLLLRGNNGQTLIEALEAGDTSALAVFARDDAQLQRWVSSFRKTLDVASPASHRYAKQLYFPVEGGGYHLLAPLYATSLQQALHERIGLHRFGEQAALIRDARRKEQFHPGVSYDFPQLAIQTFGGTKPQNVSLLNSQRRGRGWLLNSQAPHWAKRIVPPANSSTFWQNFAFRVRGQLRELRHFLLAVADESGTKRIRNYRKSLLAGLIDQLLQYAAELRQVAPGWSADTGLGPAMCRWLDVARDTEPPQMSGWHDEIAAEFGNWLNRQLHSRQLHMAHAELAEWASTLRDELRLLRDDLEEGS